MKQEARPGNPLDSCEDENRKDLPHDLQKDDCREPFGKGISCFCKHFWRMKEIKHKPNSSFKTSESNSKTIGKVLTALQKFPQPPSGKQYSQNAQKKTLPRKAAINAGTQTNTINQM